MQLLFLADLGPEAQGLLQDFAQTTVAGFLRAGALLCVVGLFGLIFACWVAAQLVTKENATLGRSLKAGSYFLLTFLLIALLAGGAFLVANAQGSAMMANISVVFGVVLALYAAVSIPMKTYRIKPVPAFSLTVIALIVASAIELAAIRHGNVGLGIQAQTALVERLIRLAPADRSAVLKDAPGRVVSAASAPEATPAPAPAIAAGASPAPAAAETIPVRLAALAKVYDELLIRRTKLQPGDQAGLATYVRDNAHYIESLNQLQKEHDAAKARTAPPAPRP